MAHRTGIRTVGYYDAGDVPVYEHLAREFAVCDRWFSSVPGATWPNRLYAISGRAPRSLDDQDVSQATRESTVTFFRTSSVAQPATELPATTQQPVVSRLPGRSAAAAIITALVIMVGAGLLRGSWMPPLLRMPVPGPPWELTIRVSAQPIVVALWIAGLLAAAGVIGALVAARRGLPVPIHALLATATLAVIAMAVLPPFGSTDTLDYAIYGHIVALGHSPYVMTPLRYHQLTHANGVPRDCLRDPSVYGPLATVEQYIAARLGGASLVRTAFWLKLANAIAFTAIAFVADRLVRGDPAARMRVHLLWTVNPLVLWSAIAGGHVDVIAAAFGVAGVLILDRQVISRPLLNALVAGICVGAAADVKAAFALFALAVAWSLRRAPGQLLAAAAGGAAIVVPSYAWAGIPAIEALTTRASTGESWGFYIIFSRLGIPLHYAVPAAVCLLVPVAWLTLQWLPEGTGNRPAARAALALSLAWLLVWPHQYAWYSLMAICVLILFPASRLDWIAVAWLAAITIADMPGIGIGQNRRLGHTLVAVQTVNLHRIAPLVMLATLVALVVCCVTRQWGSLQRST